MVQVLRDILQRGSETRSRGFNDHLRQKGSGVDWMAGEVYWGLRGGIEGQAKVLGGCSSVYKVEWRM